MQETDLRRFGALIQQLLNRQDLTRETTYSAFAEILQAQQPDLQQGAFLAALTAKGETADEVAGAWQAIMEFDTVRAEVTSPDPLIENSGTGMDSLKTFNVSSAAGIVAAACGAKVARHGARALTSKRGTVDMLERLGLDVECSVDTVARSIETTGIGLFNGMSPQVHPAGLGRILSQIRFGSTLNIAASLANPAQPTTALRGLYTKSLLDPVTEIMQEIGYQSAIVVHGCDDRHEGGIDEISITGETHLRSFGVRDNLPATLRPEDVGLTTAPFEEIAALDDHEAAAARFVSVISGAGHEACVDFTCLNAAGILLAGGIASSLTEGVAVSREAIDGGHAAEKLKQWVTAQNSAPEQGLQRLQDCFDAARLATS